jgi:hypothetical protein
MRFKFIAFLLTLIFISGTYVFCDFLSTSPFGTLYHDDAMFDHDALRTPIDFDSSYVNFEGNWPFGYSYSMSSNEALDIVFVGSGGGLYVTDVSTPDNPQILSEVRARSLIDGSYYDAATQRLYLAAYFSGVEIWDLSDVHNPTFMSRCPTEPYPRAGIYASGNYVFAATVSNGLRVLDVSDPYSPQEVASCTLGSSFWYMAQQGNYLFLSSTSAGIKVVDISDPLDPTIVATSSTGKGGMSISGNYLYVAENGFGLRIFDITNPLTLTQVGSCSFANYPKRVTVMGNHAYVAGNQCGLLVFNIENPLSPYLEGSYADYYQFITSCNGYIYVTSEVDGLYAFDVANPASPQIVDGFILGGYTVDVAVSGNQVYFGSNGFRILDASDPTDPIQLGYADVPAACVAVADNNVICCPKSMGGSNPVHVMNIDDPTNPYSEGSYTCSAMSYDLAIKENLAFVACWWDGIRIIDFTNPSSPTLAGHAFGWSSGLVPGVDYCYVQAVDVQGNYAYLVDWGPFSDTDSKGLYILDITDPGNAFLVTRLKYITSAPYDIDVEGDYAYLADSNGGMEIIDISDPTSPSALSYCPLPDVAQGIHVDGDYAYIANYILGGVQVVYIVNPNSPFVMGYYKRSGCFALNVDTHNQYVYVADGICGLQIYNNNLIQVSVDDEPQNQQSILTHNYPNPFNSTTKISFTLPAMKPSQTLLTIYNVKGQMIKEFSSNDICADQTGNVMSVTWDGTDQAGKSVSAGMYFYKIQSGEAFTINKMLIIR